jgi:hypothetical protein
MHPGLKKIVFRKLNQDLSKVEIILSENQSIWFIDRANKYWYFELEKSGKLWWRYEFFTNFFPLFCLEIDEFQPLLSEWVEGILNRGVSSTSNPGANAYDQVEGILNSGVSSTGDLGMERISTVESILNHGYRKGSRKVDEVLNHKVVTTEYCGIIPNYDLEEVLNREINELDGGELLDVSTLEKVLNIGINETIGTTIRDSNQINEAIGRGGIVHVPVEDVLNHKVVSISHANEQNELIQQILVHELIYEVESASPLDTPAHDSVDEVLEYKVTRTIPDLNDSMIDVERLLDSKQ